MQSSLTLVNDSKNLSNNIDIDRKVDFQEYRNRGEYTNIINKVIDNGVGYIIKALPIKDNIKDILIDVKNAFKTKDFKEILKTAVNSTLREGLEILNLPKTIVTDISNISKVAFTGGLSSAICSGIDIVKNRYLKNNIFSPILDKAIVDLKKYVFSNDFKEKVNIGVEKLLFKSKEFDQKCNQWYDLYEKFDIVGMNKICNEIKKIQPHVVNEKECLTQSNIINNMTELVNTKQSKLSPVQMQICNSI